eukprot:UC1_evm1s123
MPNYSDSFLVMGLSVLVAGVAEGLSYVLLYGREDYRVKASGIEVGVKQLSKLKNEPYSAKLAKKIERFESELKMQNQEFTMYKMKRTFFISLGFFFLIPFMNSMFEGRGPVARLPFEPFGFITGLTHRGLEGDDYRDCSFLFIYVLLLVPARTAIQKFFGFSLSRQAAKLSAFAVPDA